MGKLLRDDPTAVTAELSAWLSNQDSPALWAPFAFSIRGLAYEVMDECELARSDYNEGLNLYNTLAEELGEEIIQRMINNVKFMRVRLGALPPPSVVSPVESYFEMPSSEVKENIQVLSPVYETMAAPNDETGTYENVGGEDEVGEEGGWEAEKFNEKVEERVEDHVEGQAEEYVDEQAEEQAEQIKEQVEEQVQEQSEEQPEEQTEAQAEEAVNQFQTEENWKDEEQVEEQPEEQTEKREGEQTEEQVEGTANQYQTHENWGDEEQMEEQVGGPSKEQKTERREEEQVEGTADQYQTHENLGDEEQVEEQVEGLSKEQAEGETEKREEEQVEETADHYQAPENWEHDENESREKYEVGPDEVEMQITQADMKNQEDEFGGEKITLNNEDIIRTEEKTEEVLQDDTFKSEILNSETRDGGELENVEVNQESGPSENLE